MNPNEKQKRPARATAPGSAGASPKTVRSRSEEKFATAGAPLPAGEAPALPGNYSPGHLK